MNIAIVGAGIIGVSTAFELVADGHSVTVFERHETVAEEASFSPTGIDSLLHAGTAWSSIKPHWPLAAQELRWLWKWKHACKHPSPIVEDAMHHLMVHSQWLRQEITAKYELPAEHVEGLTILMRTEKDLREWRPRLQALRERGLAARDMGMEETRRLEPALSPDTPLAGAVHVPSGAAGNCRQFAGLLKAEAARQGVHFVFGTEISPLDPEAPTALRLAGSPHEPPHRFDAVILCAGTGVASLLRPSGPRIPMQPIQGYAISARVHEPLNAPRGAILDARARVGISHLGQRIRVAGSFELGGASTLHRPAALQMLYKALQDWFPGAAQFSLGSQEWKGACPMLPDGAPVVGASGIPGVWLNCGHGDAGWSMAHGCARALADTLAGRTTEVPIQALALERFHA